MKYSNTHSNNIKCHNQIIDKQFGSQAENYLTSNVHATGKEFAVVEEITQQFDYPKVLDIGCGAGHISYCLAPISQSVTAYDLSDDMLKIVDSTAHKLAFKNIKTVQGIAESLPFSDNSFDMVVSRFSAHHWQDVSLSLREMRRVCQPHGRIIIIDIMAPASPLCDTFLQTIELLRDNSHVRDYSAGQWQMMFAQAELAIDTVQTHKLPLNFRDWINRMRTPDQYVIAIKNLFNGAGSEIKDYFCLQKDGSFTTDVITLIAHQH